MTAMLQLETVKRTRTRVLAPVALLAVYAAARLLEVIPNPLPQTAIVALDVLSALAFALVHGARLYGLRTVLVFTAVFLVVGNIVENVGVLTGFPFGHYYFAGLMGPKLLNVPILLGLAYIGMAYVSWVLALLITGRPHERIKGTRIFTQPLVASFIIVAWDLAQDPVWATALHGWVWRDGGPWFGVPISNYLGWFFNVFLIYSLFALYARHNSQRPRAESRAHWMTAILFYAVCAAGNVLQIISGSNRTMVHDPSGTAWRVSDITGASALVSMFVMGAFAVFAWVRLGEIWAPAKD